MNSIDIFCNQIDKIDNQTDAESLAFNYLPFARVNVDLFGFVGLKNKKDMKVRIGRVGSRWKVISSPFASLVEKDNSAPKDHLEMLFPNKDR